MISWSWCMSSAAVPAIQTHMGPSCPLMSNRLISIGSKIASAQKCSGSRHQIVLSISFLIAWMKQKFRNLAVQNFFSHLDEYSDPEQLWFSIPTKLSRKVSFWKTRNVNGKRNLLKYLQHQHRRPLQFYLKEWLKGIKFETLVIWDSKIQIVLKHSMVGRGVAS